MKKKLFAILQNFGLADKAKNGGLSGEDIAKINAECQAQFKMNFTDAIIAANQDTDDQQIIAEEHQAMLTALFGNTPPPANAEGGEGTDGNNQNTEGSADGGEITDPVTAINGLKQTVAQQAKQIADLSGKQESVTPKKVMEKVLSVKGGAHTEKYLFGIEAPLFDIKKAWNRVAATRMPLEVIAQTYGLDNNWDEHEANFKKEVSAYGKSLASRMAQLQGEGRLATITMQDIDFTGFTGTGWGDEYIVRRQDALIAYIRTLNSISGIFTIRYGVQNKEVLVNSFLSSFSQSFQGGRVFKGNVAVEPIEARVFDLMFKHKFSNLKDLEKEYIGYLNQEGSDPMKWTWIEWVLARILEVLMNEWNERRILGCRVEPTAGKAGHYLHGSDGVIRQVLRWAYEEYRIQPVTSITTYTKTTILDTFKGFIEFVYGKVPSLSGYKLYFNEKHRPLYTAAYRDKFALNEDFTGGKLAVMDYPEIEMVPLPNMGTSCLLILTKAGNIELLENVAGEMAKIGMQRDLEELMVFSQWKEGVGGYMVGKKFANAAALAADDYQNQYIFISDPNMDLAAGATTADATKSLWFRTAANAGATAITDITSAKAGIVYRITCGATANATTIAKAGKFANITATWTPTAVGDYIDVYLYYNQDDATDVLNNKFVEVARKVTA